MSNKTTKRPSVRIRGGKGETIPIKTDMKRNTKYDMINTIEQKMTTLSPLNSKGPPRIMNIYNLDNDIHLTDDAKYDADKIELLSKNKS